MKGKLLGRMPRARLLILAKRMDSNELNPRVDCVFLSQGECGKGNT